MSGYGHLEAFRTGVGVGVAMVAILWGGGIIFDRWYQASKCAREHNVYSCERSVTYVPAPPLSKATGEAEHEEAKP